jgi:hypothetical protein
MEPGVAGSAGDIQDPDGNRERDFAKRIFQIRDIREDVTGPVAVALSLKLIACCFLDLVEAHLEFALSAAIMKPPL